MVLFLSGWSLRSYAKLYVIFGFPPLEIWPIPIDLQKRCAQPKSYKLLPVHVYRQHIFIIAPTLVGSWSSYHPKWRKSLFQINRLEQTCGVGKTSRHCIVGHGSEPCRPLLCISCVYWGSKVSILDVYWSQLVQPSLQ